MDEITRDDVTDAPLTAEDHTRTRDAEITPRPPRWARVLATLVIAWVSVLGPVAVLSVAHDPATYTSAACDTDAACALLDWSYGVRQDPELLPAPDGGTAWTCGAGWAMSPVHGRPTCAPEALGPLRDA